MDVKIASTIVYYLQTYDQTEMKNRKLEEKIRAFENQNKCNWKVNLVGLEIDFTSET